MLSGQSCCEKRRNLARGNAQHAFRRQGINQSIALARTGLQVCYAGNIVPEGTFLLDELKSAGVDTELVRVRDDIPCGYAVIQNSLDGDNCILLYGGANQAITASQVEETLDSFSAGDYLILQNEINELRRIMEMAHAKGMIIVFNPSPMNETVYQLPLEYVDYLFMNEIEAAQILSKTDRGVNEAASPELLAAGLASAFPDTRIILTLGTEGAIYIHGNEQCRQASYPVQAVDTTAAGDTFTGFFLSGMIRGLSVKASLDLAARAAAITVSRRGAAPSIPGIEELCAAEPWLFRAEKPDR